MEAYELEYGAHFTVDANDTTVYVYLGDEYDEDTLWAMEVSTMAPFAVDKQEDVTLCQRTSD